MRFAIRKIDFRSMTAETGPAIPLPEALKQIAKLRKGRAKGDPEVHGIVVLP